ncbi:hypothetical protein GOODEAATRI_025060 [Goodea atripinnis]|uniref:C3H1-type domain-containing protein n=1 Tax=Goodea atripinnis TaxID=208336 RepID=A0ABV0MUY6_9TELE
MDYKYQPEAAHRCKRDVLLCRLRNTDDPTWKRIRPRPARNNFLGAFVLCKGIEICILGGNIKFGNGFSLWELKHLLGPTEVQERQECQYGENCTFAYCQEEIDVWTQERKGALSRELLFDPLGSTERRALSVTRLLQLHMGMFMFLCEECFDSKPRIISKRSKENLAVCSNLTARHPFDDNKCLVHVVRSANVRYSKVRPLHPLCQFDICRHEVRYGCQREDSCSFAHSVIELKCWVLQQDTGKRLSCTSLWPLTKLMCVDEMHQGCHRTGTFRLGAHVKFRLCLRVLGLMADSPLAVGHHIWPFAHVIVSMVGGVTQAEPNDCKVFL